MKPLRVIEFGNPLLRTKAEQLHKQDFRGTAHTTLIKKMTVTMHSSEGIGLAAPQVGKSLSIFVLHLHPTSNRPKLTDQGIQVIINPTIISKSKDGTEDYEGCLSLPNVFGRVFRATTIRAGFQDERGKSITRDFTGLGARVFQHEYDHLQGILFVDRMTDMSSLTTGVEFYRLLNRKKSNNASNERRKLLKTRK